MKNRNLNDWMANLGERFDLALCILMPFGMIDAGLSVIGLFLAKIEPLSFLASLFFNVGAVFGGIGITLFVAGFIVSFFIALLRGFKILKIKGGKIAKRRNDNEAH